MSTAQKNQGEGNREAAKDYNRDVKEHIRTSDVEAEAKAAKKSLEGPEADDMKHAEQEGRKKSKGEDPAFYKTSATKPNSQ